MPKNNYFIIAAVCSAAAALLHLGLCVIAAIYLLRGIVFIPLMPMFPENSTTFWLLSSAICLVFGSMYALGIKQSWAYLGNSKH